MLKSNWHKWRQICDETDSAFNDVQLAYLERMVSEHDPDERNALAGDFRFYHNDKHEKLIRNRHYVDYKYGYQNGLKVGIVLGAVSALAGGAIAILTDKKR